MRTGIKVGLAVTGLTIFTIGVAGLGYWKSNQKPPAKKTNTTHSTTSASGLSLGSNDGLGGGTELSLGQPTAGAGSSQGQSSNNSSGGSSVPGPESFGQYEKYKDSKTVMYSDLQVGNGAELVAGKKAAVVYKVWLTNGTLVDQSSTDKATGKIQAFAFTLGDHSVIPGWEQGVYQMKVNGLRRLIIPSSLAYGPQGKNPVPPNAMLIIDVQLLQVE